MKRASRTDVTGRAVALMEAGAPSSLRGGQEAQVFLRSVGRMTQESTLYYSDNKIQKKKVTNKNKSEWSGWVLQRSGQVAVCVFLSIHSLQVLLLYQDVDAFLSTRGRQSQHDTSEPLQLIKFNSSP